MWKGPGLHLACRQALTRALLLLAGSKGLSLNGASEEEGVAAAGGRETTGVLICHLLPAGPEGPLNTVPVVPEGLELRPI